MSLKQFAGEPVAVSAGLSGAVLILLESLDVSAKLESVLIAFVMAAAAFLTRRKVSPVATPET